MPELHDIEELIKDLDPAAASGARLMHGMLVAVLEQFRVMVEKLEAENAELKRMLFGKSSERVVMPSARREAMKKARAEESDEQKAERKAATQKKRKARKAARKELPVVEERIEVP